MSPGLDQIRCHPQGEELFNEWDMTRDGMQVRVTLGEYVLKSDVEPLPGRTYGATQIKVHPYFRFTPQVMAKIVTMTASKI